VLVGVDKEHDAAPARRDRSLSFRYVEGLTEGVENRLRRLGEIVPVKA
jgi:hypothetical protein